MMILIAYASSEGHTRKIARHVADRIAGAGQGVELMPLSEADETLDLGRFSGVILAGSVHVGQYQRALGEFAGDHGKALSAMPSLFVSVSLAAAGHDAEDWRGLDQILEDFIAATGWHPGRVAQVAGAYLPSKYDIFRRFVMRRIVAKKDPQADLDADREYTDWAALDALVDDWISGQAKEAT
ncbi:protoporphyrinogen oxidase [Thioclava marina]|uniref:Protoporphyrinogen oxidase n=1 Tax=Thioclava marina TaxID=1915077 RepID=A0ABX3MJ19_9RHOB|nr:flavodoxin domain-containing protein [Thioclava marina]OOY11266.1 protoporphyrinogen oxidase [Thioclava marina]